VIAACVLGYVACAIGCFTAGVMLGRRIQPLRVGPREPADEEPVTQPPPPVAGESLPSLAEMAAEQDRLTALLTCHDRRCREFGRHRCHDLDCKQHRGGSTP
jgi:hypothetical protein